MLATRHLLSLTLISCMLASTLTAHTESLFVTSAGYGNIFQIDLPAGSGTSTFASGLNDPWGLAFSSSGDLFESDGSGNIYKFTPGGVKSTFASGLNAPSGVIAGIAFDSSGNLFVADEGAGKILELTPGGSQSTFAIGLIDPRELAFDSSGNLFVSEFGNGDILEFTPGGSQSTFASGLVNPTGLAFNSSGDLFVADGSDNIYAYSPGGIKSTFGYGISGQGLAFDGSGNLYVSGAGGGNQIYKLTPIGNASYVAGGLYNPMDLAFGYIGGSKPAPTSTPEPSSSVALLDGLGIIGASVFAWRKRKLLRFPV